jgi:hypothetical protein
MRQTSTDHAGSVDQTYVWTDFESTPAFKDFRRRARQDGNSAGEPMTLTIPAPPSMTGARAWFMEMSEKVISTYLADHKRQLEIALAYHDLSQAPSGHPTTLADELTQRELATYRTACAQVEIAGRAAQLSIAEAVRLHARAQSILLGDFGSRWLWSNSHLHRIEVPQFTLPDVLAGHTLHTNTGIANWSLGGQTDVRHQRHELEESDHDQGPQPA